MNKRIELGIFPFREKKSDHSCIPQSAPKFVGQTDRQTDRHCQILAQLKLRKRKDSLTKKAFGAIKDSASHKSATYGCPHKSATYGCPREQDPKDQGWNR